MGEREENKSQEEEANPFFFFFLLLVMLWKCFCYWSSDLGPIFVLRSIL